MTKDRGFSSFLKKQLNIDVGNEQLYELAFLHRSASLTLADGTVVNNERLEFLGDAIIDAVIADFLFRKFPYEREGFLTQMRSRIVNRNHLDSIAAKMGLVQAIKTYGANIDIMKKRICGDVFEALMGAMYLDKGFEKTLRYITDHVLKKHINAEQLAQTETDFKSRLMEWGQKHRLPVEFETIEEQKEMPGRSSKFSVQVKISKVPIAKGSGRSKKEAEQQASQNALTFFSTTTDFSTDALVRYLARFKKR